MSRRNKRATANRAICQSTVREQTSGLLVDDYYKAGLIKEPTRTVYKWTRYCYFICDVLLNPFGKHHHTRGEEGYFYAAIAQRRDLQFPLAVDESVSMAAGRGGRVENVGGLACLQFAITVTAHHVLAAILRVRRHRVRFATYSYSLGISRNKVTTVHQKQ